MNIALWLERRLDMSLGFHFPQARLYGVIVNDAARLDDESASAARSSFIDEGRDAYALIAGSAGVVARSFDAAALVTAGWAAPMLDDGSMTHRPSRHPQRRRIRAVAVIDDSGIASLLRFEDDPGNLITNRERGFGDLVDALETMWFGDPTNIVNLRTTRGGCMRRP
ncbi:MAG TPA: hypothetical protein VGM78_14030 [Ilumatobacteraceae bacterium]